MELYINSRQLALRIESVAKQADVMSGHALAYEEMVALPYFGQIILRFALNTDTYTPDVLDGYESMLYRIAGDKFMTDLMGSVYRKAGVDYASLDRRLLKLNDRFKDEKILSSAHAGGIRADASSLLKTAGLDAGLPVWEIQADRGEYTILVFGKESRKLTSLEAPIKLTAAEVDGRMCAGLIKAAAYCKRQNISLVRVLADSF